MRYVFQKRWVFEVLLAVICILVALGLLFLSLRETEKSSEDIDGQEDYWKREIKRDSFVAYAKLKTSYLERMPNEGHSISHLFGSILYEQQGRDGLRVCDNSFAFGCYHGFLAGALSDKGLEVLPELNNACTQKNGESETGCRHGIGHGLLEYLGPEKLSEVLEICSSLQKVSSLGCTQGVFMEYNRPSVIGSKTQFIGLRKLEKEEDLYQPCRSLPELFRKSCYYEQSQWWLGVYQNDYKRVGDLCQALEIEGERRNCFMGIGVSAAETSEYNASQATNFCAQMPDLDAQIDCLSTAGWVFRVSQNHRAQAPLLCRSLPSESISVCERNQFPE